MSDPIKHVLPTNLRTTCRLDQSFGCRRLPIRLRQGMAVNVQRHLIRHMAGPLVSGRHHSVQLSAPVRSRTSAQTKPIQSQENTSQHGARNALSNTVIHR
jgi:hypothetical protein